MTTAWGGVVLALSLGLLCPRQLAAALPFGSAQAVAVAAAALVRGRWPDSILLLGLNAVAIPFLLYQLPLSRPVKPLIGCVPALLAGLTLALLAAPLDAGGLPLAVLLLGILLAAEHRDKAMQVVGLLAMQDGIALAGLGLHGPARLATVIPVIPGLALAALWTSGRRPA